jgi:hypothetical protein
MQGDFFWCGIQPCSMDRALLVVPICKRAAILLNTA